jgi:hypothetical protein
VGRREWRRSGGSCDMECPVHGFQIMQKATRKGLQPFAFLLEVLAEPGWALGGLSMGQMEKKYTKEKKTGLWMSLESLDESRKFSYTFAQRELRKW